MRNYILVVFLFASACGVPDGKALSDLDSDERDKICDDVPKETAVCDGVEVSRSAADCKVALASVSASCDVTVGEFEDRLDAPICAGLDGSDEFWGSCFDDEDDDLSNVANNDPNNTPNNVSNDPNNTPNNENNVNEFDPQFLEVVDIIRPNCALGGCHGNPQGAAQVHMHPNGQNAAPGDMEASLSVTLPTPSGNRLIEPGEPESSEIYVRITKPAGDVQLMGAGTYGGAATPLRDDEIDTIRQWIEDGANYRSR